MAVKSKEDTFWSTLLSAGMHKKNQGKLARRLTAVAVASVFVVAAWQLYAGPLANSDAYLRLGAPTVIALFGIWLGFRLIQFPPFADFLIAVEAEMDRVNWPDWTHLYRATIVVVMLMVLFSAALFLYDIFWRYLFKLIGFLQV